MSVKIESYGTLLKTCSSDLPYFFTPELGLWVSYIGTQPEDIAEDMEELGQGNNGDAFFGMLLRVFSEVEGQSAYKEVIVIDAKGSKDALVMSQDPAVVARYIQSLPGFGNMDIRLLVK